MLIRVWMGMITTCAMAACGGGGGGGTSSGDDGSGGDTGGGGGGTPDPIPVVSPLNIVSEAERTAYYDTFLPDFSAVNAAATTGLPTAFDAAAVSGTVTYDGYMQLIMGNATVAANVIGDATLEVRFDGGPVTGSATGFLGVAPDEAMVRQVVAYEGTIDIFGGGVVEGDDGSTDITFEVDGQLDNGVNTFAVEGDLIGGFYGDGAEGLYAIGSNTGVHGTMTTEIDGLSGPGNVGIGTLSAIRQ
ncbi:hypothetical protein SLH47_19640 [Cognatiyoonia sp. IB215182]|nr:hypothetical protein [Cognatiyoonia sp. IB215182]